MAQKWLLKKGSERKFRSGHPWVFSSELAQSPKGILPGELIELRDYQNHFLAYGYGHPNSMISFRTLSRSGRENVDVALFTDRLRAASRLRRISGVWPWSHRLVFAEGDFLPGLVIDRFRLEGDQPGVARGQLFVIQSSTAGMDRLLPSVLEALEMLVGEEADPAATWEMTSIILANDSKSRTLEGIESEPKRILRASPVFDPHSSRLLAQPSLPNLPSVRFRTDFIGGQKTGFFLDQRFNIQLTSNALVNLVRERPEIRILDLCSYVGQWGTHLANVVQNNGGHAHVTLVDASTKALEYAATNVEMTGAKVSVQKGDVLDGFAQLGSKSFDVVICDPPAFIKKKKDLPTGSQAYYKLNREAVRQVASGGLFVSCSCSGLFAEDDFRSMLARVAATSPEIRWIARGGHSADHPQRPEFPQGTYLKSWIGVLT